MTAAPLRTRLCQAKENGEKRLAVLIDPDKLPEKHLEHTIALAVEAGVHYLLIGGSLMVRSEHDALLHRIRQQADIPLVLFPGSSFQLSHRADAILFLSLISGRNPELLIGQHVIAAPFLRLSALEVISCGYMLIEGGVTTAVQYISNTNPIPAHKDDIAVCTALAGEMLGLRSIYLEAGSGAKSAVPASMIEAVAGTISVPLIVGGGIRSAQQAATAWKAGADLVVVGNAVEKNPELILEFAAAMKQL